MVRILCVFGLPAITAMVLLSACGETPSSEAPLIPVRVAMVEARDVPVFSEFVGELVSSRQVTVRPRIGGIVLRQHAADGTLVEEGDRLFTIDAREAQEQRDAAEAELAAARAQQARADADVARYQPLLADEAIARQIYDNAIAAAEAAAAAVDARAAMLRQAELAIEYSEVVAPLSGRLSAALVSEGALVSAGSTALVELAVDDPLWVYINPSAADLSAYLRRERERPELSARVLRDATLLLADGQPYSRTGRINFTDRALDPTTDTYRLRIEFDNPEGELLPGQFVRVRLQTDLYPETVLIPARAVTQVLDQAFVAVLAPDATLEQRPVGLGPRIGGDWIIESGLEAGETIVVDGAQKVRPGARVQALPADVVSDTGD
ncbi:MAG: efflux RND transporter periplasmic adaptor subunit [Wenzhouxiangella sp.]|nr:efflux RND transporter periplasmic adaptor subunit [Wenzhouxiangella sp.]